MRPGFKDAGNDPDHENTDKKKKDCKPECEKACCVDKVE